MFSYSKRTERSFSQIFTDSLYLQHVQTPRSRDLAIFMPMTTTTDGQTDYFTPCACARGKNVGHGSVAIAQYLSVQYINMHFIASVVHNTLQEKDLTSPLVADTLNSVLACGELSTLYTNDEMEGLLQVG